MLLANPRRIRKVGNPRNLVITTYIRHRDSLLEVYLEIKALQNGAFFFIFC